MSRNQKLEINFARGCQWDTWKSTSA